MQSSRPRPGQTCIFPSALRHSFFSRRGENVRVYAFEKLGVAPIREAYAHLVESLALDAIVLVDGGTDILLRGDEAGLGTPAEDMASLAAVAAMNVPTRIVACLGFGVDAYHGVCHANWLENVAALTTEGAFLGATALLKSMPEVGLYIDAVNAADLTTSRQPSIVNGSIVSAIEGRFGDHHRHVRSTLFGEQNPLVSPQYMGFVTELQDPWLPLRERPIPEESLRPIAELLLTDVLVGSGRAARVAEFKLGVPIRGQRRCVVAWETSQRYSNQRTTIRRIEGIVTL